MSKYVDLSVITTGHAGTIGDPYGYADMKANVKITTTETYYIKGSLDSTALPLGFLEYDSGSIDHKFLPWDFTLNGPWRISSGDTAPRLNGLFQNCILSFVTSATLRFGDIIGSQLVSSFVYFNPYFLSLGSNSIKGCTVTGFQLFSDPPNGLEIIDSKIDVPSWGAPP
jgi:hypothetical protein